MDIQKVVTFQNICKSCVLILLVSAGVHHSFAQEISIGDFRIPETRFQRLLGSLSGGWSDIDNNSSTPLNSGSSYSNPSKSSNLRTTFDYIYNHFNENNSLEITSQFNGSGNYNSFSNNQDSPTYFYHQSQSKTEYQASLKASILYSNYIVPDQWHWYFSGSGGYSFDQEHYNSNGSDSYNGVFNDSSYSKTNQWNAALSAGIGFGKLRDGSAIFAVLRILDKLTEDSVLTRVLTPDEILQLVDLYARQVEYSYSQDRYTKYFMKDVFAELQRMGVLKDNAATAYSVLRAVEVLSEQIEPRLFGWRMQLGIKRAYAEECDGNSESSSPYTAPYIWTMRNYIQLSGDYGYPLSLNLHVNANYSVNAPFKDYQRKTNFNFNAASIYQIGERIDAAVSYTFGRSQPFYDNYGEDFYFRIIKHSIDLSFRFFIENNVNFSITGSYFHTQQDLYTPTSTSSTIQKGPSVSFGVNYRFI